jgi:excinuclease UvrABC ATPase subunit
MARVIAVRGARQNNLKNIDLDIPKEKLVVITGVSGSGKSSLAYDTIFTEAQRQLLETFSTYSRHRLPRYERPDVDKLSGLGSALVIDQKRVGRTNRSTVGTFTETWTMLRLLFARCGQPHAPGNSNIFSFNRPEGMCPACSGVGVRIEADWVIDLGPGPGEAGGQVVATGTPEEVAANPASITGRYLSEFLSPS